MCDSRSNSLPPNFPPKEILILGAGRFGYIAAKRLSRRYPDSSFLIVDAEPERLAPIREELGLQVLAREAIPFMKDAALPGSTWIIPAIPIHLAFQWLLMKLNEIGQADIIPVPESADCRLPNPLRTPDGTVYASFANFICPDNCSEPKGICTYTGLPRKGNLFEVMAQIEVRGYDSIVLRSRQMAPGVGGYAMDQLNTILSNISKKSGRYLIGTSCRCHGVLNALDLEV
ncbi:MAG: NAD-binding protein [Syntrophobacteraceae bacterium]